MNISAFFSYLRTRRRKITPRKIQILRFYILIFVLSSIYISIRSENWFTNFSRKDTNIQSPSVPSYDTHSRIAILSEIGFQEWPGSGTDDDPYIIEELKIVDDFFCLYISYTSVYFVVRNCYFESITDAARAVLFDNITNGRITNCTIKSARYGIEVDESVNCTITNCTMYDSEIGIYMNEVSNITLDGNRVFRNPIGIRANNSTACTIIRNTIYRNPIEGVFLNFYTQNCTLYNNRIGWNRGVLPTSTEQNAFDDGMSNLWDDNMSQGNFWSDWESDGPYGISGIANVFDRYPSLLLDNEAPIISHPSDASYNQGAVNNTITWNCSDEYPCLYRIYLDGMQIFEETWDGQRVVLNIDNLETGTYNYTILVSDPIHTIADVVIVRVYIDILSDIVPELLIASSLLSVVFVVLVLLIIRQIR